MRQIYRLILSAALPVLASCSQEADTVPEMAPGVPLTVSTVSMEGDGTGADTRATVLPVPVVSGKLWMGVRAASGYAAQTGLTYTYASGAWTSDAPLVLLADPVSLYAYWPQDGYPADADGKVTLTTQLYAANKDLGYALTGGDNVCVVHPYAGFVLRHAYSRLRVEISFSPQVDPTSVLDSVFVEATGLVNDGKLKIADGTFVAGGPATALEWRPGAALNTFSGSASAGYKFVGDILVAPSATVTDARFSLWLDGIKYISDMSSALTTLEAGKRYRIRAVMGASLIIDGIEKEAWNEVAPENGDTRYETGVPPAIDDNTIIDQWTNGASASGDTQVD